MRNFLFFLVASALLSLPHHSQAVPDEIPESHRSHPELGMPVEGKPYSRALQELVHLRTSHSRTILNEDKTRTTVQSSVPLHYQDDSGYWLSLRHELTERGSQFVFPSHDPRFVFDKHGGHFQLIGTEQRTITQLGSSRLLLDRGAGQASETLEREPRDVRRIDSTTLSYEGSFHGVDIERHFFHGAVVNTYVFQSAEVLAASAQRLVIQEDFHLPDGYTLNYELNDNEPGNRILILDDSGAVAFTIQPPVVTDGQNVELKTRHLYSPYQATLSYQRNAPSSYTVSVELSAEWFQDAARSFPVTVRSPITIESNEVVASCHAPAYQQSTMVVAVPQGETVLWSDLEYDFVAVGKAWRSDQRSFVSGPSGQTSVFTGSGNASGTQIYNVNLSEIANGVSPGALEYVFHASRIWGGSGCNTSFNFLNRRLVSVTYGSLVFGDGPVTINEYSASNRSFEDGFNRTEDWIELHNLDTEHYFNLEGYYLSNDAGDPTKWQITNGIVPPGGHVIVFASERDVSSGMVQHASFNLTQLRPDQIVLADPEGNVLEAHSMHVTQINHSYGRTQDGADEWGVFTSPSPGNANGSAYLTYASRPSFSEQAGTYQGSVTLEMTSTGSNEQIRYTTNGSTPTAASSLYTAPIVLSQTTVVRARTFSSDPDFLPSFIETRTYLINEDLSLPVFSFSGDQDLLTLFGGNDTLRPLGHFEYFEADGQFIDGNFGDFNKHGNDSWNYAQRGVDFISRDDYGYQRRLEHRFFETSDRTRFRRLMVKAAANDNYPFEAGGAHIRDSYIQHLSQLAGLDLDERSSTNVLLFVNGQYWGVYDLRERVDDNNYTDYYYGQDYTYRDSDVYLQFLKTWQGTSAFFGNQSAINDWSSLRQYVLNNNMGDPLHYEYVKSQLNIGSLIDYFVINSWVVSRDWLNYNTGWWRGLNPSGSAREWRYILWDMEAALGHFVNYTGLPNATHTAPPCQAEALTAGNGHTEIIRRLIQQNPEVRQQYVTRYADLLNTHFSAENAVALLDSMVDNIAPEMPRHIARWGGNITTWQNNVQAIRNFVSNRHSYLMNTGLASCYGVTGPFATQFNVFPEDGGSIRMNSEWLPSYPFNAQVFGNIQTLLTASPSPGHTFSHWEIDGAVIPPVVTEPDIELLITQASSVTAHFDPPVSDGELLYYWHFNSLVTPDDVVAIEADYSLVPGATGLMTYIGSGPRDIDVNPTGSDLNLYLGEPSGSSARVRNPSADRALVFDLPTTGYGQVNFTYAVERTNNGMLRNILSYSIDGVNFIQTGLDDVEFQLESAETYYLVNLDFASIAGVGDNPDFKIRIDFDGNTSGSSGNNRLDNISLKGSPIESSGASRIGFASINGDSPIYAGEPFFVAVQALNSLGDPVLVAEDTEVTLSLVAGSGVLSGASAGTILAGSNSLVISGVVYSQAEQHVSLGASASGLDPASSEPFPVLQRAYTLSLGQNVQGAGTVSGEGAYFAGDPVTIIAAVEEGFVFESWTDLSGQLVSEQAEWTFAMPASSQTYTANYALSENGSLVHYWHFNDLAGGDLLAVPSDFSAVGTGMISYPGIEAQTPAGIMDRRSHNSANPVSNFNLRLDQQPDSGNVLRVRNPSHENMLRIEAPSTGYRDLVVSFASTRTDNGAGLQQLFFSSDSGATWVSAGEPYAISSLDEEGYVARTFNLSAFEAVNDNPGLVFRILFQGEAASNPSGNNRFDNLSIEGTSVLEVLDRIFSDGFEGDAAFAKASGAVSPGNLAVDAAGGSRGDRSTTSASGGSSIAQGPDTQPSAGLSVVNATGMDGGDSDCSPPESISAESSPSCDAAADLADPEEARGTPTSPQPIPVMSPAMLMLLSMLLLLAGRSGLRARASPRR